MSGGQAEACSNVKCRKFRHDSGRSPRATRRGEARYLVRTRDPVTLAPRNDAVWTDYAGDGPYAERSIDRDSGAAADLASFLPGLAQCDESTTQPATAQPVYFHGDQIGGTRVLTDGDGNVAGRIVYTAFGEPVFSEPPAQAGGPTRYLYAGAWGYENFNDPAFPFLHVGERWYDPATGRFLQRDPIGISGGLNTYGYVAFAPTTRVDPEGNIFWYVIVGVGIIAGDWLAQYANAPAPGDKIYSGCAGPSGASLIGAGIAFGPLVATRACGAASGLGGGSGAPSGNTPSSGAGGGTIGELEWTPNRGFVRPRPPNVQPYPLAPPPKPFEPPPWDGTGWPGPPNVLF